MLAFDHRCGEFEKRGVQVVGVSVDSHFSHWNWRNMAPDQGGIGPVKYPLIADLSKNIARDYDVLMETPGIALRGSFLIDKDGKVRHQVVNDLPLGRNVDEMLRMVDALQFHEKHGEVCPAGWNPGKSGMKASIDGMKSYLKDNAKSL